MVLYVFFTRHHFKTQYLSTFFHDILITTLHMTLKVLMVSLDLMAQEDRLDHLEDLVLMAQ